MEDISIASEVTKLLFRIRAIELSGAASIDELNELRRRAMELLRAAKNNDDKAALRNTIERIDNLVSKLNSYNLSI